MSEWSSCSEGMRLRSGELGWEWRGQRHRETSNSEGDGNASFINLDEGAQTKARCELDLICMIWINFIVTESQT